MMNQNISIAATPVLHQFRSRQAVGVLPTGEKGMGQQQARRAAREACTLRRRAGLEESLTVITLRDDK